MKSSVGVTICAVVVLIVATLALLGSAGAAFMVLGPLSGQLFDPANLPPGADVSMIRAAMASGLVMGLAFGGLGLATGIGLIRLWKWSRYAAIVLGVIVMAGSLFPAIAMLFVTMPPPPAGAAPNAGSGFRIVVVGFYLVWAALGGALVYMMVRQSTAAQFNGGAADSGPRVRSLSVSIIAWLMIVSGVMALPMLLWTNLPAVFLGLVITGAAAKVFYVIYMVAYVVIGIGLLRKTRAALTPALALHSLALVNALSMLVPGVWVRYQETIRAISPMFADQPSTRSAQYGGVLFGVAYAALVLFFLLRARRKLSAATNE